MKAAEALALVDGAARDLLRVHDALKHGRGLEAEWPWTKDWNGTEIYLLLEEAEYNARAAARRISKFIPPEAQNTESRPE